MTRPIVIRSLVRVTGNNATADQDLVAVEAPLAIDVTTPDGHTHTFGILMRTPGDDEALALGALVAEGVIARPGDWAQVTVTDDRVTVALTARAAIGALRDRVGPTSSACGLCGRVEVLALEQRATGAAEFRTPWPVALLTSLPERLRAAQAAFAQTGGLHAAGAFDAAGTLVSAHEDVGRHNAVDKVIGTLLRDGRLPAEDLVLAVSGRVAYEIVQKAAAGGLRVIVAVGAPTDLAVDSARAAGLTLVGFTREGRANIYTGADRVAIGEKSPLDG
jgi:FdhD protein